MKRVLFALFLFFPLVFVTAADWNLVRVPAPDDPKELTAAGFSLFHRAGDYWIGGLREGATLPSGGMIL